MENDNKVQIKKKWYERYNYPFSYFVKRRRDNKVP